MCCVSLIGLGLSLTDSGVVGSLLVGIFWTAPAFWWGWRISHVGVYAEPDDLVIRNPLRTHRLRYDEVVDVRMLSRRDRDRARPRLPEVFNRRVGVVVVD